ncbi:MAG: DUF1947 domain-containing protein [Candidatus Helarchaeota archaeon]
MSFKIRERHFLKNKIIKQLRENIKNQFSLNADILFPKQSKVELIKSDEISLYVVNNEVLFIKFKDDLLPSINAMLKNLITLPKVTIDKGAVPYIVKGAHVMAPGITEIDPQVKSGTYVIIVDETHNKPLAIGRALESAEQIKNKKKGKVIQNLHYVGDKIWNFIKQLE